ncbi:TetR/AcrR family transcriptional regulator [Celeribacter indicus]|uniref:TetR family transcriptional regulator n=1 Tax=Celeribacter indicus TaxID=1208324 RepID=A0A0B5E0G0_9RHOB|nr:TetR/AcrR family transcriptional regulator C-terminal domain-containing protein [Celeribacter indicus]AJE46486.1 TetR family transcriptional regulator [Celeribacter indicus]SDX60041.1 AefR-like transcriptional repressor, C-terminal region [Celeribacter indicus]
MDDEGIERPENGRIKRGDMLQRLSASLNDAGGTVIGIDRIIERSGYSRPDILFTFGSIDDLLVTIAERKAAFLSAPLRDCRRIVNLQSARSVLIDFGKLAWNEYSTSMIALVRLMIAEGARSPDLRRRVYDAGPSSVSFELSQFFTKADVAGVLKVPETHLAAEQLLGMLREPLYEALVLHPAGSSASDEAGAVAASVDLVLHGCKRGRTR